MGQIIQLHEELLTELQAVGLKRPEAGHKKSAQQQRRGSRHTRWRSADHGQSAMARPAHAQYMQNSVDLGRSASPISQSMVVTTNTVFAVAKIFGRFVRHDSAEFELR